MRYARGSGGKVRYRLGGRASLHVVVGCGLLVAPIHHVAIYIGNGMMVNAPYTGAFVRIDSMYAPGGLIGAVRPAG